LVTRWLPTTGDVLLLPRNILTGKGTDFLILRYSFLSLLLAFPCFTLHMFASAMRLHSLSILLFQVSVRCGGFPFSLMWAYSFLRLAPGSLWLPSSLETHPFIRSFSQAIFHPLMRIGLPASSVKFIHRFHQRTGSPSLPHAGLLVPPVTPGIPLATHLTEGFITSSII
jgi:hypothetical protein